MKMTQAALAALISLAAVGAQAADLSFAKGMQASTDFDFSAHVSGTGAAIFFSPTVNVAAEPNGANAYGFLAVQPGQSATVDLGGVSAVSFEWGTPDSTWNKLLVNLSNNTTETFRSSDLGIGSSDTYIDFTALNGLKITSLTFEENTNPAFEAANFKVTAVPEPANVALLLAGLGMIGVVARRRRI
jgi:hypothetical protein